MVEKFLFDLAIRFRKKGSALRCKEGSESLDRFFVQSRNEETDGNGYDGDEHTPCNDIRVSVSLIDVVKQGRFDVLFEHIVFGDEIYEQRHGRKVIDEFAVEGATASYVDGGKSHRDKYGIDEVVIALDIVRKTIDFKTYDVDEKKTGRQSDDRTNEKNDVEFQVIAKVGSVILDIPNEEIQTNERNKSIVIEEVATVTHDEHIHEESREHKGRNFLALDRFPDGIECRVNEIEQDITGNEPTLFIENGNEVFLDDRSIDGIISKEDKGNEIDNRHDKRIEEHGEYFIHFGTFAVCEEPSGSDNENDVAELSEVADPHDEEELHIRGGMGGIDEIIPLTVNGDGMTDDDENDSNDFDKLDCRISRAV